MEALPSTILLKIFRYVWIGGYYLVKKQYNVVISLANVLLETTKQNTILTERKKICTKNSIFLPS